MPEETKGNGTSSPAPEQKPAAEASTTAKSAAPAAAAPAKPAAPAAPKPPAGPTPQAWGSPLAAKLKQRYGSGVEPLSYLGQNYITADKSIVCEVLGILHDEEQFDYCVDITAVHYPKREGKEFDLVYILYSFARNERVRVKTQIAEGEAASTATGLWPAANWLERECYDMFGIQFTGHSDLRRILLPDGWKGHPLRKDYSILLQDKEWVQANLGIESGQ